MKKSSLIISICLIFLTGFFLRTYELSSLPVSLTIDELAEGYNAISLLQTGKDEHGEFLPLLFRSIGDFKSPLLFYVMIPAMGIFGFSDFGVRITTAVLGSLTVILTFGVVKLLLERSKLDSKLQIWIALLTSLLLAISPWHVKASRMTHDGILALFLVLLGCFLLLYSIKNKSWLVVLSAVCMVLSMYAYHSEKVFTPLFVLGLGGFFYEDLLKIRKKVIVACVVGFLILIPLILQQFTPEGRTRAEVTFISRDYEINRFLHNEGEDLNPVQKIFDNNTVLTSFFWFKRYLDYFDPEYLFINGMSFSIPEYPDMGILYLFELPFFGYGIYRIFFRQDFGTKTQLLILFWIILGPIAAAFANNSQHTLRNLPAIPMYQLLSAAGIVMLFASLKKRIYRFSFIGVMLLIGIFSVGYFWDLYAVQYQTFYSEFAMDGWREAAKFAYAEKDNYKEIVIDPRFGTQGPYTVGTPYAYVLFYNKVDPDEFQTDPRRKEFQTSTNFRNFTFREIDWRGGENSDQGRKGTLYIGSQWVLPAEESQIVKKFYLKNGKEILRAASVK